MAEFTLPANSLVTKGTHYPAPAGAKNTLPSATGTSEVPPPSREQEAVPAEPR